MDLEDSSSCGESHLEQLKEMTFFGTDFFGCFFLLGGHEMGPIFLVGFQTMQQNVWSIFRGISLKK